MSRLDHPKWYGIWNWWQIPSNALSKWIDIDFPRFPFFSLGRFPTKFGVNKRTMTWQTADCESLCAFFPLIYRISIAANNVKILRTVVRLPWQNPRCASFRSRNRWIIIQPFHFQTRGITLNFALFAMLFRNLLLILEGEGGSFITSTTWARHHSICRWLDAEVQSSSKWLFTSKSITMFIDNFAIIVVLQWKSGPMLESQLSPSQTLQHAKKRKRERERSSRFFFIKSQHSHSFPASILCSGSMLANHSDVLLLHVYPLFIIYSWRGSVLVFFGVCMCARYLVEVF